MVLKTIFDDGYEVYKDIGDEFHILRQGFSPERFIENAKERLGETINENDLKEIEAFIVFGPGKDVETIYKEHRCSIFSNDGLLFQTLSTGKFG